MTYKQITIEIEHHMYILFPCAYRIQMGDLFYIGRANNMHKRIRQHQAAINRLIPKYSRVANLGGSAYDRQLYRSYGRFVRYLFDHPSLYILKAELLEPYTCLHDLCAGEYRLLRHYHGHKDCINKAYRPPILAQPLNQET